MEQYDLTQTGPEVQQILNDVQPAADAATEAYNRANSAITGLQQLTTRVNAMTYQITLPSQSGAWTGGDFNTLVSTIQGGGRVIDQNGTELSCVVGSNQDSVSIVRLTTLSPTQLRQTLFEITADQDDNVEITVNDVTAGGSIVNFTTLPLAKTDYQTGRRTVSMDQMSLILAVYRGSSIGVADGMMILSGGGSVACVMGIESNNGKTYVYRWTQHPQLGNVFNATRTELVERGNESYDLDQLNWVADSAATQKGYFKSLYHCTAPMAWADWCKENFGALFKMSYVQRQQPLVTREITFVTSRIKNLGATSDLLLFGSDGMYEYGIVISDAGNSQWDMEVYYKDSNWQ